VVGLSGLIDSELCSTGRRIHGGTVRRAVPIAQKVSADGPANGTDVPASRACCKRRAVQLPARVGGRWDLAHSTLPGAW
jgi:hypothetical protein